MQHRKEKEDKNHHLPTWTREFEGFEVRGDTPLPIRRKLAGLHQVQTTSSSVSTTGGRMALLLEHIAEDLDAPLLTHTQNMLKPVRTPVAILGSLGVCIYVPASRHWLISYSPIHLN